MYGGSSGGKAVDNSEERERGAVYSQMANEYPRLESLLFVYQVPGMLQYCIVAVCFLLCASYKVADSAEKRCTAVPRDDHGVYTKIKVELFS